MAKIRTEKSVEGNLSRFNREILDSEGIAFDHATIIDYGIERFDFLE